MKLIIFLHKNYIKSLLNLIITCYIFSQRSASFRSFVLTVFLVLTISVILYRMGYRLGREHRREVWLRPLPLGDLPGDGYLALEPLLCLFIRVITNPRTGFVPSSAGEVVSEVPPAVPPVAALWEESNTTIRISFFQNPVLLFQFHYCLSNSLSCCDYLISFNDIMSTMRELQVLKSITIEVR